MSHRSILVNDDNFSYKELVCGYKLSGKESKRKLQLKLHKKKCDICKKLNMNSDVIDTDVPKKKQKYEEYIKGNYEVNDLIECSRDDLNDVIRHLGTVSFFPQ